MSSAVINLVTGINGSGKTLFLLPHVEELRKSTGRPVYYFGIPGIEEAGALRDWQQIQPYDRDDPKFDRLKDPAAVHDLPHGAIIVIDEAHKSYPVRKVSNAPPSHIEKFAESRHNGHTFFFCTQDSQDLDLFIRRRVGKHHHLQRVWGLERATRWEWDRAANPRAKTDAADAQVHEFRYPKHVYHWYRSSDQHVFKKTLPWKWFVPIIASPVLVVAICWYVWHRLHKGVQEPQKAPQTLESPASSPQQLQSVSRTYTARDMRARVKAEGPQWAGRQLERVPGMPMSAAFYDGEWKAVAVPRIAGCMDIRGDVDRCSCNTQQGTIITTITVAQCRFYVRNGWFDPMKPDVDAGHGSEPASSDQPQVAMSASLPPSY